jgi:GAF domain-containing protein
MIQQAVAQGSNPEIIKLLRHVCETTGMGFAAVARVTEDRWIACQVEDRIDFNLSPGDELEISMTICDDIRRSGRMVVIDSVAENIEWQSHPIPAFYGFKSYASLPVYLPDGSFFGTLCAIDPEPRRVSASHIVAELQSCVERLVPLLV